MGEVEKGFSGCSRETHMNPDWLEIPRVPFHFWKHIILWQILLFYVHNESQYGFLLVAQTNAASVVTTINWPSEVELRGRERFIFIWIGTVNSTELNWIAAWCKTAHLLNNQPLYTGTKSLKGRQRKLKLSSFIFTKPWTLAVACPVLSCQAVPPENVLSTVFARKMLARSIILGPRKEQEQIRDSV